MAADEILDGFLKDSFKNGIVSRELRLSKEEIEYLKKTFPKASMNEIQAGRCSDGKVWIDIRIENC